jgi:hypothetical protein
MCVCVCVCVCVCIQVISFAYIYIYITLAEISYFGKREIQHCRYEMTIVNTLLERGTYSRSRTSYQSSISVYRAYSVDTNNVMLICEVPYTIEKVVPVLN